MIGETTYMVVVWHSGADVGMNSKIVWIIRHTL